MFDAAIIQQCADPSIEIAIVERFIAEAGSKNPLAINISSGNRIILPEPPQAPEAAMLLIERFVGTAVVRVGITQYPAGHGIVDAADLNAGLVDPCDNIRMGTALFGKVHRVVVYARGESSATVLGEAITAWRTGTFQGAYVFGEPDPGPLPVEVAAVRTGEMSETIIDAETAPDAPVALPAGGNDVNAAGMRVDLSKLAEQI
ncbi:conjugal transfer protein TraH [Devosia naphthalenivorans]|uniref:conjugal transfer protein TraH n=1 Tax=Devosia naphthalenivorans TaxID=2082392 RepID=UPI000D3A6280|nr:conjugal transfer protein TraH [Devosia naphthalenivorans]